MESLPFTGVLVPAGDGAGRSGEDVLETGLRLAVPGTLQGRQLVVPVVALLSFVPGSSCCCCW